MPLTKEQLLKPRFMVIADYPNSEFKIGEVIAEYGGTHYVIQNRWPEMYPHIFRPLKWWEERSVDDMPEYLKRNGKFIKVDMWGVTEMGMYVAFEDVFDYSVCHNHKIEHWWMPATREEYEDYITTQPQTDEKQ